MDEFKKELDEIKNELNEVKLSDEFKQNLKIKMEEEFDKPNIKEKARNILFPRKLIATFACFIFLLTSCAVFADEIEILVTHIFSNTDKKIERAIANGNYRKIDMDYVEHDGIGIKVDYIIQEENELCIAFNVKSNEKMERIKFTKIRINDKQAGFILDTTNLVYEYKEYHKIIDENTRIILCDIKNIETIEEIDSICIKEFFIKENGKLIKIEDFFEINIY